MGKSPAKWIKTKLFGKKSSGSAAAKERGTVVSWFLTRGDSLVWNYRSVLLLIFLMEFLKC